MITAWQIFPLHFLLDRTFQKIFIHQEAFYLLLCVLLIYFLPKSWRGFLCQMEGGNDLP